MFQNYKCLIQFIQDLQKFNKIMQKFKEVQKIIKERSSLLWAFLERVTRFGNDKWIGWLLHKFRAKILELSPRKIKILVLILKKENLMERVCF